MPIGGQSHRPPGRRNRYCLAWNYGFRNVPRCSSPGPRGRAPENSDGAADYSRTMMTDRRGVRYAFFRTLLGLPLGVVVTSAHFLDIGDPVTGVGPVSFLAFEWALPKSGEWPVDTWL